MPDTGPPLSLGCGISWDGHLLIRLSGSHTTQVHTMTLQSAGARGSAPSTTTAFLFAVVLGLLFYALWP